MTDITRDEIERFKSSIRSHEISPELVLVDPELGRIARIALMEEAEEAAATARAAAVEAELAQEQPPVVPAYYALDPPGFVVAHATRAEKSADAPAPAPSRILALTAPSILSVSLLMNLMLAGVLLAGGGDRPTLVSPEPTATLASTTNVQNAPASVSTVASSTRPSQRHPARPSRRQTSRRSASRLKATAERTVLALVQTAPRSRIAQLIDPTSGLLKNNVQSVCHRRTRRGPARFLCVVRPPDAPRGAGLYVHYTVTAKGRWSVTWLGYRKG